MEQIRGKAILVTGFPGAGKTEYCTRLLANLGASSYVDDYHRDSIDNDPSFAKGRRCRAMVDGLRRGEIWISDDIDWCKPLRRRAAEEYLRREVPRVVIEWHFLAVDETTCKARVRERARPSAEDELQKIEDLSKHYHLPPGSKVIYSLV